MRIYLGVLFLASLSVGAAKPRVTIVSAADLRKMAEKANAPLSEIWQTGNGLVIHCEKGMCGVSCEAQPPLDAPEVPLKENDYGCVLSLKLKNIRTYLDLVERASDKKPPAWDSLHSVECDRDQCRFHSR